jgi:large subunit ribosomal protein L13
LIPLPPLIDCSSIFPRNRIMKTTVMAKVGHAGSKWHVVDASDRVLGRLAAKVASLLMGKTKPTFTPHVDAGDFVIVVNAEKIAVTGRKADQKVYRHHTGYIGGLVARPYKELLESRPEEIIQLAVRRMLPKSRLGRSMFSKLKVYRGPGHPHAAQKPEPYEV